MLNPTLTGLAIGFAVGAGFFVFRIRFWPVARVLGLLTLAALALAVVFGAIVAFGSMNKGGDSAIAGMTALVVGGLGLLVVGVFSLIAGAIQGSRMGLGAPALVPGLLGEPLALLMAVLAFQAWVITPVERETTQRFIEQESARREKMKRLKEAIPPRYREVDSYTLDIWERQQRQREQMGVTGRPFISQEDANKLRNYWNATTQPQPVPDGSGYQIASKARLNFNKSIAAGWLSGALLLPFCFKKRVVSAPGRQSGAPEPPALSEPNAPGDSKSPSSDAFRDDAPPPGFQV